MPTPAERKALVFFSLVALLGGSVRCWRSSHPSSSRVVTESVSGESSFRAKRGGGGASQKKKRRKAKNDRPSDADLAGDLNPPLVDLDVASVADIDAIGVLPPGLARRIVEDRVRFGAFGSLSELERIPYFPRSAIVKLAPRVTFSRLPRPSNAVIRPRPSPPSRRTRRASGSS